MSFAGVGQWLRCFGISAFACLALPAASWAQQSCATCTTASAPITCQSCQWLHCPPAYLHCQEGPPRIHWHCGCPHPICNPCDLPHAGYFETCWYPWPYPATQCVPPTPASLVVLHPLAPQDSHTSKIGPPSSVAPAPAPRPIVLPPTTPNPIDELQPPRTLRP